MSFGLKLNLRLGLEKQQNFVLDSLSAPSAAAYSLRKLRSAYSGDAIRVRRSSDNAEQDIGFVNNELDVTALTAFVGYNNLLLRSEQFDGGVWESNGVNITANATTAPDGTLTADRVNLTAGGVVRFILQNSSSLVAGTAYTQSFYVRADEVQFVQMTTSTGFPTSDFINFDINNGTIVGSGTLTGSIESAPNGWYRISATATANAATGRIVLAVIPEANSTRIPVVSSGGAEGLFVWGAQLNAGALQPYQQTVATANIANGFVTTWYDQSGNARDTVQTTAVNQPSIVNAGVIETAGTSPAIVHDGVDDGLIATSWGTIAQPFTRSMVIRTPSTVTSPRHVANSATGTPNVAEYFPVLNTMAIFASRRAAEQAVTGDERIVWGSIYNTTASYSVKNGIASALDDAGVSGFAGVRLGGFNGSTAYSATTFQEFAVFESELSTADRQTLERNQGTYFGITVS